ncbi:MAG: hypothetical protein HZB71_12630 [Betaproteobacteria bacterium]|nr:hypothetical protein [Betaproteobacteria bacterium]
MFETNGMRALTLAACLFAGAAAGSEFKGNEGKVILSMCQGADKVKALSVMCHSYLNGYMDATRHYSKEGRMPFCLGDGDKEKAPAAIVEWLNTHAEAKSQPAGAVVLKALSERFPCKGGK